MPKQTGSSKQSLADKLKEKNPQAMRRVVQPVDILAAAAASPADETKAKTEQVTDGSSTGPIEPTAQEHGKKQPAKTERKKRTEKPAKKRSGNERIYSDDTIRSILALDKRKTERYSFEIYTDQKEDIEKLRHLYEKETGLKLPASRLIREVLDSFLPEALALFEEKKTDA